jgi:hypothetical protein
LSDRLADGTVTNSITHRICTYNIIITHAFLLVNEMQMCGRVIFAWLKTTFSTLTPQPAEHWLNSLLPYSLTLYYLALEYQPRVVIASMRT